VAGDPSVALVEPVPAVMTVEPTWRRRLWRLRLTSALAKKLSRKRTTLQTPTLGT
jgi:hypothetical protein